MLHFRVPLIFFIALATIGLGFAISIAQQRPQTGTIQEKPSAGSPNFRNPDRCFLKKDILIIAKVGVNVPGPGSDYPTGGPPSPGQPRIASWLDVFNELERIRKDISSLQSPYLRALGLAHKKATEIAEAICKKRSCQPREAECLGSPEKIGITFPREYRTVLTDSETRIHSLEKKLERLMKKAQEAFNDGDHQKIKNLNKKMKNIWDKIEEEKKRAKQGSVGRKRDEYTIKNVHPLDQDTFSLGVQYQVTCNCKQSRNQDE